MTAVGIGLRSLMFIVGAHDVGTEMRSRASISHSTMLITVSTSQLSPAIQLIINLILGRNLLTSTDNSETSQSSDVSFY